MIKWVLIIGGGLVVLHVLNSRTSASGSGTSSGGSSSFSFQGAITSLSKLTDSIGHLFNKESTAVTDRDALISPNF